MKRIIAVGVVAIACAFTAHAEQATYGAVELTGLASLSDVLGLNFEKEGRWRQFQFCDDSVSHMRNLVHDAEEKV